MNPQSTMNEVECEALLEAAEAGVLSSLSKDGSPYAVPVHFVTLCGKLYVHSGFHGQKLENIRHDPRVSFVVWALDGYCGADDPSPCKTGTDYRSVVLRGTAHPVEDAALKREALNAFAAKYTPQKDVSSITDDAVNSTCVIELRGTATGKKKGRQAP